MQLSRQSASPFCFKEDLSFDALLIGGI